MNKDNRQLLVIIHGWGFDTGVFKALIEQLDNNYRIQLINLPGYGGNNDVGEYSLQKLSSIVNEQLTEKSIVIGWSMGGLIAVNIAIKNPEKIEKLVLLTSTPCFGKKEDWIEAMDRSVLENFVVAYNKQPKETLTKFSYLASEGSKNPRNWIRELKKLSSQPVSQDALEQGLKILLDTDLRDEFAKIDVPTLMILGEKDSLVPVTVEAQIKKINEKIIIHVIKDAGHTPFMTDTEKVAKLIKEYVA